ncbi:MAG: ABC transporter substrate-binding protein [Dehalococcoidia bacterium]|nr:ABC transporter substrate-binding protein [Dehalococcoidia bacterium]
MKVNFKLVTLISAVMALMLVVLACAPAATTQKSEASAKPEVYTFYLFADVSGPYAAIQAGLVDGFRDAMNYISQEKGGIDGVPMELVFRDTAGDLKAAIAAYEAFRSETPKPFFMWPMESATGEALKDRFIEDDIVGMTSAASAATIYPAGNIFTFTPSYTDGFGFFIDWLVQTQPKPIKLAILTWDNTFGRAILTDECRDYCKQKGVELVAEEVFGATQMDVTTQLTRIKDKGANWVFTNTLGGAPAVILKSADSLGLIGKMNFSGCQWALDKQALIGLAGPLAEGFYGPSPFVSWDEEDNPYIKLVSERAKAAGGDVWEKKAGSRLVYCGLWTYMKSIIEQSIAEVGWDKLSGKVLRKYMEQTNAYDCGTTSITYSPTKHESVGARVLNVKNSKILPVTDWGKCPDLRPAKYK